jgi:hypothetical protein
MIAPVVVLDTDLTLIAISWVELSDAVNGGLGIDSYLIEIFTSEGGYEVSVSCDGSDPTIMADLECKISLISLLEAPFSLAQGDMIEARVTAINSVGSSTPSVLNTFGALLELVPHRPPTAPTKNYSTT